MALNQLKRTLVNDVDAMGVECRARNAEELSLLLQGMPDLVDKLMAWHVRQLPRQRTAISIPPAEILVECPTHQNLPPTRTGSEWLLKRQ